MVWREAPYKISKEISLSLLKSVLEVEEKK
jgi:hypothetical protein